MEHFGEGPRHSFLDPRLYGVVSAPGNPVRVDEDQDRQIIDKWLLDKGKFQLNAFFPARKPRCDVTLSGAKQALRTCLHIIDKLDQTQEELRSNVDTMSSQEWKQRTLDIGSLKDEFDKSLVAFEDNTVLRGLKGAIVKRAKKRGNRRKSRGIEREARRTRRERQAELHKSIDGWLESKREEAERAKMEEKMKKDADCVLDEVTKKKSEARKQLSLISALVKLRSVRDGMAAQRGEKPSFEDRKAFGLVTEKLIRMWENSYQNYCKEEQCLKVMLEHNATEDTKAAITAKQTRVIDTWERLFFGPKTDAAAHSSTYWALTSADRDSESFVAIRKSWDTFLATPPDQSASAIPIGWVTPPLAPNDAWTAYLTAD